ncbi:MAG TPA: response regulator transcription factor [Gemmatimonadota bacterium]|nr:response regulator transcription factor [Gemmatimonadota bacterium]
MTRVLIVEDNETLALGLRRSLEAAGFQARVAADGRAAEIALGAFDPDLVVLDLMLPEKDGFELLEEMRAAGSPVPVLILTARGEELDKLRGFRLGADDYVVKPVGVLELIARVEAILRRIDGAGQEPPQAWGFGDVEVDRTRRTVRKGGEPVQLSRLEFELLSCLLDHRGAVVDRATLLDRVWGYKRPVPTRTIDTHIATLRAKIEDRPARPRHILTVRKVGYRLRADDG